MSVAVPSEGGAVLESDAWTSDEAGRAREALAIPRATGGGAEDDDAWWLWVPRRLLPRRCELGGVRGRSLPPPAVDDDDDDDAVARERALSEFDFFTGRLPAAVEDGGACGGACGDACGAFGADGSVGADGIGGGRIASGLRHDSGAISSCMPASTIPACTFLRCMRLAPQASSSTWRSSHMSWSICARSKISSMPTAMNAGKNLSP